MNIHLRTRGRSIMLLTLLGLVAASTLGACGRIGPPHQPAGSRNYYMTYPNPQR
ncbi:MULTISPECIES: hypothetical protein [Komagataeibacter]|uniref:Lipoprotein n=4 Tax=Komagataeibacter TaxID=1434011 RepID=A0A0D6Q4N8_KOMXY|nr:MULTISPECIES: hypothetical protein [Komagataeibacter]GBR31087.1 hypothetical protein AA11826_0737 [Komagataeibacter oboediens DSM 11826]KPH87062.1 hypothetical protein GLUCOINTEAF2_0202293 [Komagataeibacter intermedius AF2]MBL7232832.1 hypothetical protein [Komagataeibacter oboediens]MBT0675575.1 hypothetical protein [Komagataeibacter oboediens]MBT0679068.1 hypothetical protein [Komagataeibacter oboediens]